MWKTQLLREREEAGGVVEEAVGTPINLTVIAVGDTTSPWIKEEVGEKEGRVVTSSTLITASPTPLGRTHVAFSVASPL